MKHIVIIGGGIAGMQCAVELSSLGISATVIEKEHATGGKLASWHRLFPSFTPAEDVLGELRLKFAKAANISLRCGVTATEITPRKVTLSTGDELECDAVVLATGFTLFDARIKEEYGYGIYDNVVTSADLEDMFNRGEIVLKNGNKPRRIALLHCVGSRDEKVCQRHCSKVCCVTGVKQAIELKEMFPSADVFNFYMDIRMFGPGYEEMYREAQVKHNVHFVRGRISEVSPTIDGRLQLKAEDTLTGRPLKMSVDMLVLLVGMRANEENATLAARYGLQCQESGFMKPQDNFMHNVESNVEGIFYAGTITSPKSVGETLNEATTVALRIKEWLHKQ
jgi:heterodisulfide reductase subunit A